MLCTNCSIKYCSVCEKPILEKPTTGTKHVIDLDQPPFVPNGWKLEKHVPGGKFEFDPSKIALHLEPEQEEGKSLKGFDLQKRLEGKPAFNANLLDWLLAHPELIPESWKVDENGNMRYIYFWNTVYRDFDNNSLYVRELFWKIDEWYWSYSWINDRNWDSSDYAAVRVK